MKKNIKIFWNYNKIKNEIILTYNLNIEESEDNNCKFLKNQIDNFNKSKEEKKIRLFGEKFVKNNKNYCYLFINNKKSELIEYYYLSKKDKINNKLIVKYIEKEKITNMSHMFSGCKNLLSISNNSIKWDISNITDMNNLFSFCESLEDLPNIISLWDTSNATNMENIFSNCLSLKTIPDISKWNTTKVTQIENIFFNCKLLKTIPDISNWDLSNIKILDDYNQKYNSKQNDLLINTHFGKFNFNLKSNCLCIIKGSECGLGILCRFSEYGKITEVLLTFYNILNEDYLLSSSDIIIKLNNQKIKLSIKERRIWCNSSLDYTCVEIIYKDNIKDFYSLDYYSIMNKIPDDYYRNQSIILVGLMENKRFGFSQGTILYSNNFEFKYSYNSFSKQFKGIIINQKTNNYRNS